MSDKIQEFLKKATNSEKTETFQLAGDASARRYFRVHGEKDQTYVLMVWEPFEDESNYPFLNVLKHFERCGVQVPEVVAISKQDGLVLLEDLGDLTLERKFWENLSPEYALEYYRKSIDELLKIHYKVSRDHSAHDVAFKIEFNTERLLWEMNYAREHLLEKLFKFSFNSKDSAILDKTFHHICERLHHEPKYVAHRDYHSRNIMLKAGKTRIIDFQDARLGPVQYDLVSLLKDSYVDLDPNVANGLIEYYLEKREELNEPPVDLEKFFLIYELQTVQRCFKACGSFASFKNMRNDNRYLKHIVGTLKRVQSSLQKFNEYQDLYAIFNDIGLFETDLEIPS